MSIKSILLEATEYADGTSLVKAILRGQVVGISKRFFNSEEPDTKILDKFLQIVKTNFDKLLQNKAIVLLLNKAKYIDNLQYIDNQIIDATKTYFNNINKSKAKEPEVKKLFDKFEEVDLTDSFNQEFENRINRLFIDMAKMKSNDEYEVIYPTDEEGWEVVVPKTFAAAKSLSSIKGLGKAYWCTSASSFNFNDYTRKNNKLYMIRNVKKKILYQMDWGYAYEYESDISPSFKNFRDKSVSINEVLKNIPLRVLSSIKNKKGVSVVDLLDKFKNEKGEEKQLDTVWKYEELSKKQFLDLIEQYHININVINSSNKAININLETVLSDKNYKNLIKFFLLKNGNKKFLYIDSKEEIYDKKKRKILFPIYELKENGKVIKHDKNFIAKENLPEVLKGKIFNPKELEKPIFREIKEVKDYLVSSNTVKLYEIKNLAGIRTLVSSNLYSFLKKQIESVNPLAPSQNSTLNSLYKIFNSKRPMVALYFKVINKSSINEFLLFNTENPFFIYKYYDRYEMEELQKKERFTVIASTLKKEIDPEFFKKYYQSLYNRLFNKEYNLNYNNRQDTELYKMLYIVQPRFIKNGNKFYYLPNIKQKIYFCDKYKDIYKIKRDGKYFVLGDFIVVDKNNKVTSLLKKEDFDKFNVSFSDFRVNGYYDKLESFTIKVNKELVNAAIKEKKEELEKTKALIRKNTK